jgi:hypothetical protein
MHLRPLITSAAFAAMSAPGALMAAELCAHPFDTVGPCLKTYSVIAIPYMAILTTYAVAPLVILRPRFESGRAWAASLIATPLVNYVGILAAFTLISALGATRYPHDTTPYYYIDWSVMIIAVLLQSAYIAFVLKRFGTAPRAVVA